MTVAQFRSPAPVSPPAYPDLLELARNPSADSRERLLLGVVALCDARPPSGELSPVLGEIFLTLARQAERDVRKLLSERLALADWAPPALINVLALDEIEIARPVLAASPVLQDDDLLRVLVEATLEHQIEIARRGHHRAGRARHPDRSRLQPHRRDQPRRRPAAGRAVPPDRGSARSADPPSAADR